MHIIGIAGRKQSGKTTVSNYLHGHEMKLHDVVKDFSINNLGNLVVNYVQFDDKGKEDEGSAVFDLWQQSDDFMNYAQRFIWPLIRGYNFADSLKEICMNLFGLSYDQVYGTDSNKNTITNLLWENMPGVMTPLEWSRRQDGVIAGYNQHPEFFDIQLNEGPMTARQFMEYFGTDVMKKMYGKVWINNCLNRINHDQSPIAIISDCRFIDEVEEVKNAGGVVINLTRNTQNGSHKAETDLDNYKHFDAEIDNQDMTVQELCNSFLNIVVNMGITKKIRSFNNRTGTTTAR